MSDPLSRLSRDRKKRKKDEQEFSVRAITRETGTKELIAGADSLEKAKKRAKEVADDYELSDHNIFVHSGREGIHLRLEKEEDEIFTFEDLTKK
jgi:rRNA maturation endonuclease Nob1